MSSMVATPRVRSTSSPDPQYQTETPQSGHQQPSRQKNGRWTFLLALLLIVVSSGAMVGWRYGQTIPEAPATLTLEGNVDVRQVNLSFKVAGRIESMAVDEGDAVQAGQRIASLDPRYFEDDLRLARAQRDQAAANLDKFKNGSRPEEIEQARAAEAQQQAALNAAQEDYNRAQRLRNSGAVSIEEYDSRKAVWLEAKAKLVSAVANRKLIEIGPRAEDIAVARAQFDQAVAQVVSAERRLEDCQLIAPNDGIILTRAREKGAIVNPGEVAFTLTLASPIWIRTYVGEPDLGVIQPGLPVIVKTDGHYGRSYPGKVGFISPTAEFTPKTVETRELRTDLVYRLRIIVDNPDGGLRQGMPVSVFIQLPGQRQRNVKERLWDALGLNRLTSGGR